MADTGAFEAAMRTLQDQGLPDLASEPLSDAAKYTVCALVNKLTRATAEVGKVWWGAHKIFLCVAWPYDQPPHHAASGPRCWRGG